MKLGRLQTKMNNNPKRLIYGGLVCALLAALCCITPLLPITLTALGLTGLLGVLYKDTVLLPAMGIFLLIAGYGLWRHRQQLKK